MVDPLDPQAISDFRALLAIEFERLDYQAQKGVQHRISESVKAGALHSGRAMLLVAEEFSVVFRQRGETALVLLERSLSSHGLYVNEVNKPALIAILNSVFDEEERRCCEMASSTAPFRSGIQAKDAALEPIRKATRQEKIRISAEVNLMAAKTKLILDECATAILARLKEEFATSQRPASALSEEYEGPSLADVENEVISSLGASKVDYDLSLKNLEDNGLVKTGPMELYDNPPNSGVFVVAFFSKRKFMHLTEAGYRASSSIKAAAPRSRSQTTVNITGSTFHQSPVGVGQTITQSLSFDVGDEDKSTTYLIDLLSKNGTAVDASSKADITQMVKAANDGNMAAAKPIFQRLFGAAEEAVKQLAYGVLTAILTKQMGL